MKQENNNIDNISKDLLFGFESDPPIDAWDNIAAGLKKQNKKKALLVFYRVAAGIAILLSIAAGYYFIGNQSEFISDNQMGNDNGFNSNEKNQSSENISINNPVEPEINTDEIKQDKNQIATQPLVEKNIKKEVRTTDHSSANIVYSDYKLPSEITLSFIQSKEATIISNNGVLFFSMQLRDEGMVLINNNVVLSDSESKIIEQNLLNLNDNNSSPDWAVGGALSPVYSFRNLVHNNIDPVYVWGGGDLNELNEQGIVAFSGGVNVEYNLDKLSFSSGIYYSQLGQKTNDISINRIFSYNTNPGVYASTSLNHIVVQEPANGQLQGISLDDEGNYSPNILESAPVGTSAYLTENFEFVEFPFVARYSIIDQKADVKILAGFSTSILVGNKSTISFNGQERDLEKYNNLRTMNYNSIVGIGFQYPFGKNLNFSLQPVFKYALNPLNKDYSVEYYPYSFAVYTGFSFDF